MGYGRMGRPSAEMTMEMYWLYGGKTGSDWLECSQEYYASPEIALASIALTFSNREHTSKIKTGEGDMVKCVEIECADGESYTYSVTRTKIHEAPEHL